MTVADFQALERASPFPRASWAVDFGFRYLPTAVEEWKQGYGLDLDPDFQREHVWTEAQQAAFVEYVLSGGPSGRDLYFACEGWSRVELKSRISIVDGKQRLTAVLAFMGDKLRVRGKLCSEWTGVMRELTGARFRFNVADVDRLATLRWYLALNGGGTPHTPAEIERVRVLLRMEEMKLERATP